MRKIPHIRKIKEQEHRQHLINMKSPEKVQIMNYGIIPYLADKLLSFSLLKRIAFKNTLKPIVTLRQVLLKDLPTSFNGYRILFMTDFHIDGNPSLLTVIKQITDDLEFDCVILGGDYRFRTKGPVEAASTLMKAIIEPLNKKAPVYAVLGNHDAYDIGLAMEEAGARVLINDSAEITRKDESIMICGLDDCHYYTAHDFEQADEKTKEDQFKVLLSHSTEVYKEAAERGFAFYLAGHTHAGQICLPGGIPIITESHAPRSMVYGEWSYNQMKGYTSAGIGTSGIAARLNCPPEIAVLELIKDS